MTTTQDEASGTQEHVAPPEAWDAIADGYDRYVAPQEVDLASEALRLVGLEPGERFLDVAAGTGGLSLPAARLGAQVLATDWSPAMIERFEARVREEGLSNAAGRVMDCHALELPDDHFDVTGSQFGVMLVPEFPGLPDDPPPLEFQVSDPDVLRRRLTEAGLKDVRVERTAERPAFASGQEMWDWVLYGNPIPGMLVTDLTQSQQARLRQVLDGMLRERAGANRHAVLTNAVNIGIGTK
jgi:SAM-dependent methyltransferase